MVEWVGIWGNVALMWSHCNSKTFLTVQKCCTKWVRITFLMIVPHTFHALFIFKVISWKYTRLNFSGSINMYGAYGLLLCGINSLELIMHCLISVYLNWNYTYIYLVRNDHWNTWHTGYEHPKRPNSWWRHQMGTFPRYWPFVRGSHRSPVNSLVTHIYLSKLARGWFRSLSLVRCQVIIWRNSCLPSIEFFGNNFNSNVNGSKILFIKENLF